MLCISTRVHVFSPNLGSEGLLDAIRKRHSYAATDNIVLDFQAIKPACDSSLSAERRDRGFRLKALPECGLTRQPDKQQEAKGNGDRRFAFTKVV